MPEALSSTVKKSQHTCPVRTTCPYCGVGCGVLATFDTNGTISVSGDKSHPANYGRLCSKGSALAETLTEEHRLLQPVVNNNEVTWDTAIAHVAEGFGRTIERYGPEAIAFYVSGQLLTEDYYVVNKFTKGWLGTANIDSNSRLCMASSVVGHKRAFGSDTVPGCYEDLESADVIILVGSNLAWCHPVLHQRMMAEKQRRPEVFLIAIDPRRTATADMADMHLPIRPDGDTLLFNGLLAYLHEQGLCDKNYIDAHVSGFDEALANAQSSQRSDVAHQLGIELTLLNAFYNRVASHAKTVTLYSQGVNQSRGGTDKVNAIINTHLATGRIGVPGAGPFSITGQPNAMGGREVGGLATMLAAHMELNNSEHRRIVQQFWQSPTIAQEPGLCAVDLFEAVADGRIKAIWIMGTNPVDSVPDADGVKRALAACPLVVVSDVCSTTDTLAGADVRLPALPWGEKEGTVTNSERCISRQRAIRPPLGNARPDWWAVSQVAQKMGFSKGFRYTSAADIFREHAALSAEENHTRTGKHADTGRDFDIGATASLTDEQYTSLAPFYWPWRSGKSPSAPIRFFANGQFYTPSGKANMEPVNAVLPSNNRLTNRYPMTLNTGRIRDQWHTMTRTGYTPKLQSHIGEPFMDVHPQDAVIHGLHNADIVQLNSRIGRCLLRVSISDTQSPGHVYAPMHWTDVFASSARVDTIIEPLTDPYSKQPASKNQPVSIQRFNAHSYAYVLHRDRFSRASLREVAYWALSPVENGWRYEMASTLAPEALQTLIMSLCQPGPGDNCNRQHVEFDQQNLTYSDTSARLYKRAIFNGSKLQSLGIVSDQPVEISRAWAQQLFSRDWQDRGHRHLLLAGRAAADQPDKGAIVCSCFHVGASEIKIAIAQHHCQDVQSLGQHLQAGTNCGSCRSELQGMINRCAQTLKRKCTTSPSRMT